MGKKGQEKRARKKKKTKAEKKVEDEVSKKSERYGKIRVREGGKCSGVVLRGGVCVCDGAQMRTTR